MATKLRKYCPHCGSRNVHTSIAYPFDKRRTIYWCSTYPHTDAKGNEVPPGCGWCWCKPFDEWLLAPSIQAIEETGGIVCFSHEYLWEEILRCSCGRIFKNSEANWIQLDWTPKGVLSMTCPKCGKHGQYLESYFLVGKKQ